MLVVASHGKHASEAHRPPLLGTRNPDSDCPLAILPFEAAPDRIHATNAPDYIHRLLIL